MNNIAYLFDPKSYLVYSTINAASEHGNNVIPSVTEHFSIKNRTIGQTVIPLRWRKFDINAFKTEYIMLRRILFNNRTRCPNNQPQRLKYILLQMENKPNIFVMSLLLFRKILCLFSGIIDVERQNGIKKWLIYSQRERLKIDKVDKILRIFCNSPCINDVDKKEWLVQVAKIWWRTANRRIECAELDKLCNTSNNSDNN